MFDDAVKGVQAVAHTASPFHFNVTDPQQLIDPAVKGTTGILKSIQKNKWVDCVALPPWKRDRRFVTTQLIFSPDIKRIVITSSVAAVMSTSSKPPGTQYTEADWNEDSIKEVEQKGKDTPGSESYRASKTLAERALWGGFCVSIRTWTSSLASDRLPLSTVLTASQRRLADIMLVEHS